jgi:Lrp/AsnC family leucine-responsive transcriptional regulator
LCKPPAKILPMSKKSSNKPGSSHETSVAGLDGIECEIIRALQRKGRATNEEIGDLVGLSPSAASRRIHALETRGVILGYQAIVDRGLLGAGVTVFVRVTLERQSATALQSFESAIRRCNSVASCHLMAGDYDYMLQVKVADMGDYERVHQQELSRFPGVRRLESNFAVREVVEREIRL